MTYIHNVIIMIITRPNTFVHTIVIFPGTRVRDVFFVLLFLENTSGVRVPYYIRLRKHATERVLRFR